MKKIFLGSFYLLIMMPLFVTGCQNKKPPVVHTATLQKIHYDFDRASIRPDMVSILDGNVNYMKQHPELQIVVEGHCDERGTNEYNLALGDHRAMSAKVYMVRQGVPDSRIRTVSYGEEKPLDFGHNEAAWYTNRRAEFHRQ